VLALTLGAAATDASATTFEGACQMQGLISYERPYTLIPWNNGYTAHASGTCTGTLDGKPYDGPAGIDVDARMNKPMACEVGVGTNVPGTVYYGTDPKDVNATLQDIYLTHDAHVATELPLHYYGAYSGQGAGEMTFRDHLDRETLEGCAGSGINQLPMSFFIHTITPVYG
jgi:hypothetical protein